jgi:menaquinol-cytochrome c reductase iron-sulfur subunit
MLPTDPLDRRRFISRSLIAVSGLAGLVVGVPIVAYLLDPLLRPAKNIWRDVGPVDSYVAGQTTKVAIEDPSPLPWAGQTAQTAVYIRRDAEAAFTVFAVNCTHLGCPVTWLPNADLFMCPCHGGVYYGNGDVAGGPPPRPLFRHQTRIENGRLEVLTHPLQIA